MSRRERQRRRKRKSHPVVRVLVVVGLELSPQPCGRLGVVGWVTATANSAPNLNHLKPHVRDRCPSCTPPTASPWATSRPSCSAPTYRRQRDPTAAPTGDGRDRGPALLPARRGRLRGAPARGRQGRTGRRRDLAGRLDADDAARRQRLSAREHRQPPRPPLQDHPGQARQRAGGQGVQELDPRNTSTTCPTGPSAARAPRGRRGLADVLQQAGRQLDLAQTALLAGLPQAPSAYNPFLYPKLARQRRHEVFAAMVSSGYITRRQERPPTVHRCR